MKVSGLKELQDALVQLGGKYASDAAKKALNDASKVPAKAMRQALPRKSGQARKSIRIRTKPNNSGVPQAFVGSFGRKAWYIRLLERGTKAAETDVTKTRKGRVRNYKTKPMAFNGRFAMSRKHPGIKAGNYLQSAFERSVPEALKVLKQRLREQIIVQAFKKSRSA